MKALLGALLAILLTALTAAGQTATTDVLLQSAASANGNGTVATVAGYQTAGIQITNPSGSPTFTVNFEGSVGGSTYAAVACRPSTGGTDVTTATAAGVWRCNVAGLRQFRARISGYAGSGTITVHAVFMAGGEVSRAVDVTPQLIAHYLHVTTAAYFTDSGAAGAPAIARASDTDTGLYWPGANQVALTTGAGNAASGIILHAGGLMTSANGSMDIGTSAGSRFRALHLTTALFVGGGGGNISHMTSGVTINQGGADDEILAGKSSDVAHGLSDAATDTFFNLTKIGAANGGIRLSGFREDGGGTAGISLVAVGNDETDKNTSAQGAVLLIAFNHDGTASRATPGADANLVAIVSGSTTRFIFDAEGTFHADDSSTTFDHWDDVRLVRAIDLIRAKGVIPHRYDSTVGYDEDDLIRAGLLSPRGPNGERGLWNVSAQIRLLNGAIWQLYVAGQEREERLLARLEAIERDAAIARVDRCEPFTAIAGGFR